MTSYSIVPLNLGVSQQANIRRAFQNGESVKLKLAASALANPNTTLALTKTQVNKLQKALTLGTGAVLTISYNALKKSAKSGSGLFGFVKDLAGNAVQKGIGALGSYAGKKIRGNGFLDSLKKGARRLAGDAVELGIKGIGSVAGTAIRGRGLKPQSTLIQQPILIRKPALRRVKAQPLASPLMQGDGFLRDISAKLVEKGIGGLASVAGSAIRGRGIQSKHDLKRRKKRQTAGRGIYAPGVGFQ